jgi:hypothetical protein
MSGASVCSYFFKTAGGPRQRAPRATRWRPLTYNITSLLDMSNPDFTCTFITTSTVTVRWNGTLLNDSAHLSTMQNHTLLFKQLIRLSLSCMNLVYIYFRVYIYCTKNQFYKNKNKLKQLNTERHSRGWYKHTMAAYPLIRNKIINKGNYFHIQQHGIQLRDFSATWSSKAKTGD